MHRCGLKLTGISAFSFKCSIKNLPRKVNRSNQTHFDGDKSFFFYLKLVALVSYLSTLKSQINILSIISLLIFITAGFCVCMLVGLVCFLTLYLLHSNSFLLIFRELYTYMYNVCCPASCPMYSFFMCLQTSLLFVDFSSILPRWLQLVIYLKQDSWGALEINLSLFFHSFPLFIKKKSLSRGTSNLVIKLRFFCWESCV